MQKFWKAAIAACGLGAVGAFVFWSLYKQWLTLPIFSKISDEHTFLIMLFFLGLIFFALIAMLITYVQITHNHPPGKGNSDEKDMKGASDMKLNDSEALLKLQELESKLNSISDKETLKGDITQLKNYTEMIKDCKLAANWVEMKEKEWAEEAVKVSSKKFPNLLDSQNKKKIFCKDICKYLDWLRSSLIYGDLKKLDVKRSIKYPFPYQMAITHIRNKKDYGNLPSDAIVSIEECFDYIIKNLSEF